MCIIKPSLITKKVVYNNQHLSLTNKFVEKCSAFKSNLIYY